MPEEGRKTSFGGRGKKKKKSFDRAGVREGVKKEKKRVREQGDGEEAFPVLFSNASYCAQKEGLIGGGGRGGGGVLDNSSLKCLVLSRRKGEGKSHARGREG